MMFQPDLHAPKPEGSDAIPSQAEWTPHDVTSKWKRYTGKLVADGKAPYNRLWPRLQLYTAGEKVRVFAPELVEVDE